MEKQYQWFPKYDVIECVSALSETQDYNIKMMNIPEMWKKTRGKGIKVVILDSGVPSHPDLRVVGGKSFVEGYYTDSCGHACHCGGILNASANGIGVIGVAPEADVYYGAVLGGDGSGSVEAIVRGIRWAVDVVHADIISMSLGLNSARNVRELESACNYAKSKGVAIFAAAGNESGPVGQPGRYDSVYAVAAVNDKMQRAAFSDYGPEVDFAAGGVNVFSTYLNNGYAKLSGTSMSTPAVSGLAALVLAAALPRKLTPDELAAQIRSICVNPDNPGGTDIYDGAGIPVFKSAELPDPVVVPVVPTPAPAPSKLTRFIDWFKNLKIWH